MLEYITVNEHASIRVAKKKILYVDPFRIPNTPNDADIILVTHEHYDHFSYEDILKVRKKDTIYVFPESMRSVVHEAGIPQSHIIFMVPGDEKNVSEITVEAVASYNVDKPMHPKENGWLGYVITLDDERIYICGDCDAIKEGRDVSCRIAMVPIGATYTMNALEAAEFVNQMKPDIVIPIHYGTLVGTPRDYEEFAPRVHPDIRVIKKLP